MRKLLLSILITCSLQPAFSQSGDIGDIQALTRLNQAWLNAYLTKDSAALASIFADDFELISHSGKKFSKKDIIANLANQETVSINTDSINVRLLTAEVGLVTVYTTFVLKAEGKKITGTNCYQDVYIKRKGAWKAVAAHVTLLSMK